MDRKLSRDLATEQPRSGTCRMVHLLPPYLVIQMQYLQLQLALMDQKLSLDLGTAQPKSGTCQMVHLLIPYLAIKLDKFSCNKS